MTSRVARPLLASIFVAGGMDAVQHPESKVKKAEKVTRPLATHISAVPGDTALLVRLNGGVQVGAALLLSVGRVRRLSALVLAGSIIPTTVAGHRFWEELDDETRNQQRMHFFKNLGILGGLILAATDTEGAPSLTWRIRRQAHTQSKSATARRRAAGRRTAHAVESVSDFGVHALREAEGIAVREAPKVAEAARQYLHGGADRAGALLSHAHEHFASA